MSDQAEVYKLTKVGEDDVTRGKNYVIVKSGSDVIKVTYPNPNPNARDAGAQQKEGSVDFAGWCDPEAPPGGVLKFKADVPPTTVPESTQTPENGFYTWIHPKVPVDPTDSVMTAKKVTETKMTAGPTPATYVLAGYSPSPLSPLSDWSKYIKTCRYEAGLLTNQHHEMNP